MTVYILLVLLILALPRNREIADPAAPSAAPPAVPMPVMIPALTDDMEPTAPAL